MVELVAVRAEVEAAVVADAARAAAVELKAAPVARLTEIAAFTGGAALPPRTGTIVTM
jgi:hypothetical protein